MTKTPKITTLAGSRQRFLGWGGGLLPPRGYKGLKTAASGASRGASTLGCGDVSSGCARPRNERSFAGGGVESAMVALRPKPEAPHAG